MKNLLLILIFTGINISLNAQALPMFETTIWVKDALGHLDSVVIGYDLNDIFSDTSQFHEVLDNSPYDSVFDVRVELRTWETLYQYPYFGGDTYKRLITDAETAIDAPWCTLGGSSILYIQAKYQPVTLYWDRYAFDAAHCRDNTFFTPDKFALTSDPPEAWFENADPMIFACASKTDSLVCMLPRSLIWDGDPNHYARFPFISIREVEGIGLDTIVGLALEFVFGSYYSPCRLVSGTEAPVTLPDHGFRLQPNPTSGAVQLHNERSVGVKSMQLMDPTGRLILQRFITGEEIISCDIDKLPPGIYYIGLRWDDGYESIRKLVKI